MPVSCHKKTYRLTYCQWQDEIDCITTKHELTFQVVGLGPSDDNKVIPLNLKTSVGE